MPIRLGIIGLSASPTAWVSTAHMAPLLSHPSLKSSYQLTALATSSPATAAAAAQKWNLPLGKAYHTPEAIAADPDVDMVVVGVKLPLHRELALPALRAGKDVFVEWPLAIGEQEIEELCEAARRGGGRTVVGLQGRCSPAVLKAKEIIESGTLGRITSVDIYGRDNILLYLPPIYDYEHDAKNAANITTIATGHSLDTLCFILSSEFTHLTASVKCNHPLISTPHHPHPISRDAPDSLSLFGVLDSGTEVTFHYFSTLSSIPPKLEWTFVGEKGALRFEGTYVNMQMVVPRVFSLCRGVGVGRDDSGEGGKGGKVGEGKGNEKREWEEIPISKEEGMGEGGVGEIYRALVEGEKVPGCLVDFEGAARRHRMLEACVVSSREGRKVSYRK